MGALEANLAVGASILLGALSLLLFAVAFVSWRRIGHPRLLWVAAAFVLLTAKGILHLLAALEDRGAAGVPWAVLFDLAVVMTLYLAVLKE